MIRTYLVKYEDKFGIETTTIVNDGKTMKLTLRGAEFIGYNFHSFRMTSVVEESMKNDFNLFVGDLCGYSMNCQIPLEIVSENNETASFLQVYIEYGEPVNGRTKFHRSDGTEFDVDQQINVEVLRLEIEYQGQTYTSKGKNQSNSFDEQLVELRDSLPSDVYLKTCWNCAFADYHPAGSGIFGGLACFRNTKKEYSQVTNKRELMHLWSSRAEDVQEVHLCPEFDKRQPGNGGFYVG